MARANDRGLELSFKKGPNGGRWFKTIGGKEKYFGSGAGVSDRPSYRKALEAYRVFTGEAKASEARQKALADLRILLDSTAEGSRPSIPLEQFRALIPGLELLPKEVSEAFTEIGDNAEKEDITTALKALPIERLRTLQTNGESKDVLTVADLADKFLAEQKTRLAGRNRIAKAQDNGSTVTEAKNQFIGNDRWIRLSDESDRLKKHLGSEIWDKTEATAARLVKAYRQAIETANGDNWKPASVNEAVKYMRQLCGWADANYLLDRIPRDKGIFKKYGSAPKAKAIAMADLYKLYDAGSDREKLWFLLSLNCGFYAIDLSNLKDGTVLGNRINFTRGKTGVNVNYLLWPETARQLKRFLPMVPTNGKQRVFLTDTGTPLVHHVPGKKNPDKLVKIDNLKNCLFRLMAKLKMKGYSYSNFRDTAATAIENIDPALTDVFIAHVDSRMAAMYVDGKMVDTSRLDTAIAKLEQVFKGLWDQSAR